MHVPASGCCRPWRLPPEIDAMEWLGNTPTIDYATIHWGVERHGHHPSSERRTHGQDLSPDFTPMV